MTKADDVCCDWRFEVYRINQGCIQGSLNTRHVTSNIHPVHTRIKYLWIVGNEILIAHSIIKKKNVFDCWQKGSQS